MDDAMEEDCTSIKDTLLKLIKSLYSNNQECIDAIPETRIKGLSSWLKHEESDGSVKLNEDLYLSYSNTHGYFDFTKRLLKFLNADPYDVVLLCKPKK